MKSLGQTGSAKPKVRPGDYERALALIVEVGGDKSTKAYLKELVATSAAIDKDRTEAEGEVASARLLTSTAREAEDAARSQREALAAETTITESRLSAERTKQETERLRLAEWAKELEGKDSGLKPREAALRRAFDAYNGE